MGGAEGVDEFLVVADVVDTEMVASAGLGEEVLEFGEIFWCIFGDADADTVFLGYFDVVAAFGFHLFEEVGFGKIEI